MGTVTRLFQKDAAKDPDAVLEQAIGNYETVFILGYDKSGHLDVRSSTNWDTANVMFALESFKHRLMNGDYSSDD